MITHNRYGRAEVLRATSLSDGDLSFARNVIDAHPFIYLGELEWELVTTGGFDEGAWSRMSNRGGGYRPAYHCLRDLPYQARPGDGFWMVSLASALPSDGT